MAKFEEDHPEAGSGIVEWTPPNMNWNPWINQPMIIEGAEEYQVKCLCRSCCSSLVLVIMIILYHLELCFIFASL